VSARHPERSEGSVVPRQCWVAPLAAVVLLASLAAVGPAAPAASPMRGDVLYRATLLRAAPGRLLDLVAALRGKAPWIFRHSQGDHWDLMLLAPAGSDAPVAAEETLVAWQEDELVRGPDLAALPGFAEAGFVHIEMFHALAGKRAELLRQREMENAYLATLGQPQNAIFVRETGASWDAFTIGAYRNLKHYAEAQDNPADKDEAAARGAGFASRSSIGPYLRTLIQDHHDTLAVPVR
jgi:hypothetical protein